MIESQVEMVDRNFFKDSGPTVNLVLRCISTGSKIMYGAK